ncbi:hypothetical protein LGL08_19585 [Clostridium estertheticum]|uniref:hypothetical protein n=1 Tax=Clostridium estertheticum TaxID=238834 RepID=UPI001CF198F7|nr:hypothetical protein [Clostridium estertheticum]MCB2308715.1 hypothetical protein [Clostridium estertheticum]MCB2347444.1 hypothetical protein [Clostridium estertheticum]MCB2351731.1 hypothetical protein [Clostridium estertheticum]WAG46310.1 hypothetical protein LL127_01725 [Clostridium estertheticum]
MNYIINSFHVEKIFFPKQTSTSNIFKDFVSALKNKGLKLTAPSVCSTFKIVEATITILAPNGLEYEYPNYGIKVKLSDD